MGEPESAVDPRVAPRDVSQPVSVSPRPVRRSSPPPRSGDRADRVAEPVADRRGRFGRFRLVEEGTLRPHFVGAVESEPGQLSAAQSAAVVDENDGKARFLGPANCARGAPGKLLADLAAHVDAQVRAFSPPLERRMDDVADGNDPSPEGLETESEAPSRPGMGAPGRKASAGEVLPGRRIRSANKAIGSLADATFRILGAAPVQPFAHPSAGQPRHSHEALPSADDDAQADRPQSGARIGHEPREADDVAGRGYAGVPGVRRRVLAGRVPLLCPPKSAMPA